MRTSLRASVCAIALLGGPAGASLAQTTAPSDDRVTKLEQRLDAMEREHQVELKQRDDQIADLRARLDASAKATTPTPPPSRLANAETGLLDEIDNAGKPTSTPDGPAAMDRARSAAAADSDNKSGLVSFGRAPVSFNPDLAVVSDFLGSYSTNRQNDARNRLDVREVELDLRAAVHPNADAVAILAFGRDVDDPVFPTEDDQATGPDSSVDIEEAYVFLHDFGVPNLTAKLGRFHIRFGRQNIIHLHDLPTSDPPLVNQAFLAPEALSDSGVSLSYVIPPKLVGNQYVELVGELLAGEGAGSESPTLRGDVSVDSPAINTHVLWNHDFARDYNLELGASALFGKADADNEHDVELYGADATLIHTDPTGGFFNQLVQAELMYGDTYDESGHPHHGWGAYVLGQQQLNRDWYAGLRLDYTEDPNADDASSWAINPYVSFYWSEFLRFRVQYQHKDGDGPSEDTLFFQATWIFGAHPPHPYWAMR